MYNILTMNDITQILTAITADLNLLNDTAIENADLLKRALGSAMYNAAHELNITSGLAINKSEFFESNILYVTVLGCYLEYLAKEKIFKDDDDNLTDEQYAFVNEHVQVFIVLLTQLFKTKTINTAEELQDVLPCKLYISAVSAAKDDDDVQEQS